MVFYLTTGANDADGGGTLWTYTDTSGANSSLSGSVTTIDTIGNASSDKRAFRGIAFTPAQLSWDVSQSSATWNTSDNRFIQDGRGAAIKYHQAYAAYFGRTNTDIAITVASGITPANIIAENDTNTYTLTGAIGGPGGITKNNGGTLRLDGANTFGGGITVNGGTLQGVARSATGESPFGKNTLVNLNGGNLRLDSNLSTNTTTTLTTTGGNLFINGGATLTINQQGSGEITLRANSITRGGSGTLVLNPFTGALGSGEKFELVNTPTFINSTGSSFLPWLVRRSSDSSAAADYITTASGIFINVTYDTTTLSGSTSNTDLVNLSSAISIASVNALAVKTNSDITIGSSNTLTLGGSTGSTGLILNGSGTTISGGTVKFGNGGNIEGVVYTANTATISSVISGGDSSTGGNGLTVFGPGTLTLSGTNTFSGAVSLNQGTLAFSANNNLGATGNGLRFNGGTISYTGSSDISSARAVAVNSAGGTIHVSNSAANWTISGNWSGSGNLTKTGDGKLTLSGNTLGFGGNEVRINAGTLALTGSDANTSLKNAYVITVGNGATLDVSGVNPTSYSVGNGQLLQGRGTVQLGGKVLNLGTGATISGGIDSTGPATIGTLTITNTTGGGTTLMGGGSMLVKMQNMANDASGTNAGINYDRIAFGNLTLDSGLSTTNRFTIVLKSVDSNGLPGSPSNYPTTTTSSYVIGTYTGTLGGTFNASHFTIDVTGLQGYNPSVDQWTLNISGNNIVLTFTPIPEPGTVLLVSAVGLGLLGLRRRLCGHTAGRSAAI